MKSIKSKIKFIETTGTWRSVADGARTTVNMEKGKGEPSSEWKKQMILAEHSPIRKLNINWKWKNLKSWISVHFVRHKIGIEHFVRTQRTDRTGIDRDKKPQGSLVEHEVQANIQAIITISRKRLCNQASTETKQAWQVFLGELKEIEPEVVSCCVPECVYRGFCPELHPCGYFNTPDYKKAREKYIK